MNGSPFVSGEEQWSGVAVNIVLDSGCDKTAIPKASAKRLTKQFLGARVIISLGEEREIQVQTHLLHLVSPCEEVGITLTFEVVYKPGHPTNLGQLTLR